jgi:transcriptional regulator with XRE-family HTH domain
MKTASDIAKEVRAARLLSMNTLAELAGIPASTISRIERGKLEPTCSMLNRILQAAGFSIDLEITESGGDQPIADFLSKLQKLKRDILGVSTRELLAVSSSAPISKRNGLRRFDLNRLLPELYDLLYQQGQNPVVSSLEAFAGNLDSILSFVPIIYVNDSSLITGISEATVLSSQVLLVIDATDNVRKASRVINEVTMVSAEWGLLDALASPGRQPDATLELMAAMRETAA